MADPMSSFLYGMQASSQIMRGRRQDEQDQQLFDVKMDAYARAQRQDEQDRQRKDKVREAAGKLAKLESSEFSGADVAGLDPQAGFSLGDLEGAFDEDAQRQAVGQVLPLIDKAAQGQPLAEQEMEPLRAAGGALAYTGVLARTVPEIREQAGAAQQLQQSIVQLGQTVGPQLLGKKTVIDAQSEPELFAMFNQTFPAVSRGSKGFKEGAFTPVQFYVDGTGAKDIREVRIIPVGEGVNPQTGERYRAPMTVRRSGDADDQVSATPLGEIYAQAGFTERAAKALLATIVENDDAAAQKYLDRYYATAEKVAEERRKRAQNTEIGAALGEVSGLSEKERGALKKAVAAGANPKDVVEALIKARPEKEKVEVTWRDNVEIGGKPFQVAYDKSGKEVARVPQWVKDEGSGKGSGGRGGKGLDNDAYKLFDDQLNKQFLAEFQATLPAEQKEMADLMESDAFGNQRVSMERVVAKMPPAMRERYNAARQVGENFMADGSLTPILAANKAYRFANQPQGGAPEGADAGKSRGMTQDAIDQVPAARLNVLQQGLKNAEAAGKEEALGFLDELRQTSPAEYAALTRTLKGSGRSGAVAKPQGGGMAPTPERVRDQMFTNVNRSAQRSGWNPDYPVELIGKGLKSVWKITPIRLLGVGAAKGWDLFHEWATTRYDRPDAAEDPQVLAEFAKENPEIAQQIARAAAQAAQQ